MKKLFTYPVFLIMTAMTLMAGCKNDKEEDVQPTTSPNNQPQTCDTNSVTFSGTVMPIFASNCNNCHNSTNPSGGIILDTHAGARIPAANGRLMGSITHASGYRPMPQGGAKLSDCNIAKIKKWVDDGAPQN